MDEQTCSLIVSKTKDQSSPTRIDLKVVVDIKPYEKVTYTHTHTHTHTHTLYLLSYHIHIHVHALYSRMLLICKKIMEMVKHSL